KATSATAATRYKTDENALKFLVSDLQYVVSSVFVVPLVESRNLTLRTDTYAEVLDVKFEVLAGVCVLALKAPATLIQREPRVRSSGPKPPHAIP
ncbi:MAG TPA: hypothetical protein PKB10_14160, partial [Tepidisphaeraceae bacterium]|nr:hypothetical protein [Tepidisphaeraceae bacterium]